MNEVGAPGPAKPAALAGLDVLRGRARRIARARRLAIPVETAVRLIHAAEVGTFASLLVTPDREGLPRLSDVAREAVVAAILADAPMERDRVGIASMAISLGVRLGETEVITPGERLLTELLDRLSRIG